jgi:hypothetical protein
LFDAAEFHDRFSPSLSPRHASAQIVVDVQLEMALHFGGKLAFAGLFVEEVAEP